MKQILILSALTASLAFASACSSATETTTANKSATTNTTAANTAATNTANANKADETPAANREMKITRANSWNSTRLGLTGDTHKGTSARSPCALPGGASDRLTAFIPASSISTPSSTIPIRKRFWEVCSPADSAAGTATR